MKTELSFYERLIKAKSEMGAIKKSSNNPFFKSKYADLTTILEVAEPALLENGLVIIQPISEGKVTTKITDGTTSIESSIDLGTFSKPQDLGSAITYYRRYTLQSLLAISAEDDDGNRAQIGAKAKLSDDRFNKAIEAINDGKAKLTDLFKFDLSEAQKEAINNLNKKDHE